MENYISILRFVNNPLSDESIALGLIVVSENDVFFKMSAKKINFAKKLNPVSGKLLDFSLLFTISFCSKNQSAIIWKTCYNARFLEGYRWETGPL